MDLLSLSYISSGISNINKIFKKKNLYNYYYIYIFNVSFKYAYLYVNLPSSILDKAKYSFRVFIKFSLICI